MTHMRSSFAAVALLLAAFALGCPKAPRAVLPSIATADDLAAVKARFNADVEHRRVLVLLSPT